MNIDPLPPHEYRRLTAAAGDRSLADLVERRIAGEPLQYLEGTVQFGPMTLTVDRRVLIPRPETEHLASELVGRMDGPGVVVDLCTGSGALALFLKHAWPQARVIGTDNSSDALEVARTNGTGIEWLEGDLFTALPAELLGKIDLLVANPPYIAEEAWDTLPRDVRHEPRLALVAGPEGTEVIQRILTELPDWISPGGEAWIEIGETQGWLASNYPVQVVQDQYGVDRYLRWT
ncbi:peptide chain release factor N(5)-glutamine methyltransferase [soil metagenome]